MRMTVTDITNKEVGSLYITFTIRYQRLASRNIINHAHIDYDCQIAVNCTITAINSLIFKNESVISCMKCGDARAAAAEHFQRQPEIISRTLDESQHR